MRAVKIHEVPSLRQRVSEAEWQARVELAASYRLVAHYGWTHLINNHISLRVPGTEDQFLINPYGLLYEQVTASNLVKIDVDGIEPMIVAGARQTLATAAVKSVLIEINTNLEDHWTIIDTMLELGFDFSREQVAQSQREEGPFKGVANYVFRR